MEVANVSIISPNPCLACKFRHSSAANRPTCSYYRKLQRFQFYAKDPSCFPYPRIKSLRSLHINSPAITLIDGSNFRPTYTHVERPSRLPYLKPCTVAKDDPTDLSLSGESTLVDELTLNRNLQVAIEEENYSEAAKIRDQLRLLHEDSRASVLTANAKFYNAFRKGDLASMQSLWAQGEKVCCVHPGASGISGYELVMKSWEYVWMNYEFPLEIELKDIEVYVRGDVGYVTCVELVKTKGSGWGRQFATNVFERVDQQWLICIHHASPVDL